MPKLTPTERLAKIDEAITKEELAIEASKEKIRSCGMGEVHETAFR